MFLIRRARRGPLSILLESYCNPGRDSLHLPRYSRFQFSSSLIATEPLPFSVQMPSELSILLESYCNEIPSKFGDVVYYTFNSPRVLLQHILRRKLFQKFYSFNSPRVLLQLIIDDSGGLSLPSFNSPRVLLQPLPRS